MEVPASGQEEAADIQVFVVLSNLFRFPVAPLHQTTESIATVIIAHGRGSELLLHYIQDLKYVPVKQVWNWF